MVSSLTSRLPPALNAKLEKQDLKDLKTGAWSGRSKIQPLLCLPGGLGQHLEVPAKSTPVLIFPHHEGKGLAHRHTVAETEEWLSQTSNRCLPSHPRVLLSVQYLGQEKKHISWNMPVKAGYGMIKNRLWSQTELNQAQLLPSCVTSRKSFTLSVHQFPQL